MDSCNESLFQEVEKYIGLQPLPVMGVGPALEPIKNTPASVMGLCTAIITLEKVTPVMMLTFSFSINFLANSTPKSGLS